ncbi:MAG TPA: hypothetical protein PKW07_04985 [Syntrophorhabdaceae bacterium]|nr:hypothetical protein [Syntrophorhabdaceae bacterium]
MKKIVIGKVVKIKNYFIKILLALIVLFTQGCATYYTVKVNSYIDPSKPLAISPGTTLHIVEDANTKNPLLEKEFIGKLSNMLRLKGFDLTGYDKAKYFMLYGYGIGHERTITSTMPLYTPGQTATVTRTGPKGTSYSTIYIPDTTKYVPTTITVTDKWLSLKLVDGEDYRKEGKNTILWLGESSITGEDDDIRYLLNYLIAGLYRFFGENTGKTLNINIRENDLIVKDIANK